MSSIEEGVKSIALIFSSLLILAALLPVLLSFIPSTNGTVGELWNYIPLFLILGLNLSIIYYALQRYLEK